MEAQPELASLVGMDDVDDQNGAQGAIVAVEPEGMRIDEGTPVWVKVHLRTHPTLLLRSSRMR